MDFSFRHDLWWARLRKDPCDEGTVDFMVLRPQNGERQIISRMQLTPEGGIGGDRWIDEPDDERRPGSQVSLMRSAVLRSFGQDDRQASKSGDNLIVSLDLSEANLPVGSKLYIGSAILEVSEDIHRPCAKFHERFGKRAAQRIARANRRGLRGRGVLCSVMQAGEIHTGDRIRVKRPG